MQKCVATLWWCVLRVGVSGYELFGQRLGQTLLTNTVTRETRKKNHTTHRHSQSKITRPNVNLSRDRIAHRQQPAGKRTKETPFSQTTPPVRPSRPDVSLVVVRSSLGQVLNVLQR